MNMNQFMHSEGHKILFGFLGFGVPLILLAIQVFLGIGNLPLVILTLSWFGLALLLYTGLTDDEAA